MAKIEVRFYSLWRLYLDVESIALEADRVDNALDRIEEMFGERLREQILAHGGRLEGGIRDNSIVVLNGFFVKNPQRTDLKDGDVVKILPQAAGG
jgi:molybdopterin converting factor small subunit